MRYEEPPVKHH